MYFEARAWGLNQTSEFLTALAKYQETGQHDPLSSVTVQMLETGPFALFLYSRPAAHPAAFDSFFKISPFIQLIPPANGTLLDIVALSAQAFTTGTIRFYGETFSHKVDAAFMIEAYEIFAQEIANLPSGAAGTWVPTALAAAVAQKGEQFGGNVLGLSAVPQQWHEWFITWTDPAQDAEIYALSSNITAKVIAAAKAKNVLLPYLFMNTAGKTQDVLSSYGAENVETIKQVAAKYDPKKVFQNLQNDGYLVSKLN